MRAIARPALLLCLAACDGGREVRPVEPVVETALGRLFDARGAPAAGVEVTLAPSGQVAVTDARGAFTFLAVPSGATRVSAPAAERCVVLAPGARADLGELYAGMPSTCGRPAGCVGDVDCDGVDDALELEGWTVVVHEGDGTQTVRAVVSAPDAVDSDLDGLDDAREYAARLDPQRRDTDGDLLGDYAELVLFRSNGADVDTDGDGCPPPAAELAPCVSTPALWDGFEVELSKTSPTLADTDGDGLRDDVELLIGGTNPRVADLPQLELRLYGDPLIELDVDYQTGTSRKQEELERDEEERVETDNVSTKLSVENTVQLHTETEAGTETWPPSFSAKLTTDTKFQHGYFHDTSASWTRGAVERSQRNYETWEQELVSFDDGKISVAMKVVNRSELSFALDDLRVLAFRLVGGGAFSLIGTLQPDATWGDGEHVLGPGAELTLTATLEHVGASVMRAVVQNPSAMTFEVGAYALYQLDALGATRTVSYAKLGEAVVQRAGLVVVDYGDGRVTRRWVATNVFRRADGEGDGVPLREALAELGVEVETVVATSSLGAPRAAVLARVDDVSAYDTCRDPAQVAVDCAAVRPRGFWLLGGVGEAFGRGPVAIDEVMLGHGERVYLVYEEDRDGDGVFDREEQLLGTRRTARDTDGDGLSDYDESKVGWTVAAEGRTPYVVYSDPRFADLDGDLLSDQTERSLGSDPLAADTDGDGDRDTVDVAPLAPPCLDGDGLGLTAWWDGSYEQSPFLGYLAQDVWRGAADDRDSDGVIHAPDPSQVLMQIDGDRAFRLNQRVDARDEFIEVASDPSISPQHELTVSAWIFWQGLGAGSDGATLLAKGETYVWSITAAGRLRLALRRNLHDHCWYCSFGSSSLCTDWSCADSDYDDTVAVESTLAVPTQTWVHVAASFGGEMLRVYVDGLPAGSASASTVWWSGWYRHESTTTRLVGDDTPLRIGLDGGASPSRPFRGIIDDVQLGLRGLGPDRVALVRAIGVCVPRP